VPQSQNRSRATIAPEMDENDHMRDAHISRVHPPIERSNTKTVLQKLQLQLEGIKPKKESVSAPTTPTNVSKVPNSELMSKLAKRREGEDS
jgi:hypothetical protein